MRFSTIFAFASLAAVASAGTFSLTDFSSNNTSASDPACYECAMNTFLKAVPACQRSHLDNINAEVMLTVKGRACLCPVSALVIKPEILSPCAGRAPMCSANFIGFTTDIFSYIGKNNNCSSTESAVSTPPPPSTTGSDKPAGKNPSNGANSLVSSDNIIAFGAFVAMAAASLVL
ncbi:hypothetical protein F5H01DRAFT_358906 [Linnemannia elongata]|nr:hypothetical protein F5H01DRAFT_358906 [Linnemannia elongata]